jgi:dTDP-4-dehydrorhamnose 3,5-epimerase-like enzyme
MHNQVEPMCTLEDLKVVTTIDPHTKSPNGRLIECIKESDKTLAYITIIAPHSMKGYHLHNERTARYVCLKGKVRIVLYSGSKKEEYTLDEYNHQRLIIPPFIATGLINDCPEEAWILNVPTPPYDPKKHWEQEEFTEAELKATYKVLNKGGE